MATETTADRECPTCGAAHITAADARTCCPPSTAELAALADRPGAGFYAARHWPMRSGSDAERWLREGGKAHDAAVSKIEALHASEPSGCDCGGDTSGPSVVMGVVVDGVHECRDASAAEMIVIYQIENKGEDYVHTVSRASAADALARAAAKRAIYADRGRWRVLDLGDRWLHVRRDASTVRGAA